MFSDCGTGVEVVVGALKLCIPESGSLDMLNSSALRNWLAALGAVSVGEVRVGGSKLNSSSLSAIVLSWVLMTFRWGCYGSVRNWIGNLMQLLDFG